MTVPLAANRLIVHDNLFIELKYRILQTQPISSLRLIVYSHLSVAVSFFLKDRSNLLQRQNRSSPFFWKPVTSSVHVWALSLHAAGNPLTGGDEWGGGPSDPPKCI